MEKMIDKKIKALDSNTVTEKLESLEHSLQQIEVELANGGGGGGGGRPTKPKRKG